MVLHCSHSSQTDWDYSAWMHQPGRGLQLSIGWNKLFYGQIANTWAYHIDYNTQYQVNGTIFYSKEISAIWKYILNAWATCNKALHNPETALDFWTQALEPQIQQIFQAIEDDPILQAQAPQHNVEDILCWPIWAIRTLISKSIWHIQMHTTEASQWAQIHTQDICMFLQPWHGWCEQHPIICTIPQWYLFDFLLCESRRFHF